MMNRIFGQNTHTYLHILGLSAIAFGLPWSKALMSVGMMFIVLNLLLEGDFKSYLHGLLMGLTVGDENCLYLTYISKSSMLSSSFIT